MTLHTEGSMSIPFELFLHVRIGVPGIRNTNGEAPSRRVIRHPLREDIQMPWRSWCISTFDFDTNVTGTNPGCQERLGVCTVPFIPLTEFQFVDFVVPSRTLAVANKKCTIPYVLRNLKSALVVFDKPLCSETKFIRQAVGLLTTTKTH